MVPWGFEPPVRRLVLPGVRQVTGVSPKLGQVRQRVAHPCAGLYKHGVGTFIKCVLIRKYEVIIYKTNKYSGEMLNETEEGKVFWVNANELLTMNLAPNMDKYLQLFFSDVYHEAFAKWNSNHTGKLRII